MLKKVDFLAFFFEYMCVTFFLKPGPHGGLSGGRLDSLEPPCHRPKNLKVNNIPSDVSIFYLDDIFIKATFYGTTFLGIHKF